MVSLSMMKDVDMVIHVYFPLLLFVTKCKWESEEEDANI